MAGGLGAGQLNAKQAFEISPETGDDTRTLGRRKGCQIKERSGKPNGDGIICSIFLQYQGPIVPREQLPVSSVLFGSDQQKQRSM